MWFLIDAQLPPGLAINLRGEGHEAVHVSELLPGEASDGEVLAKAHQLNAVLATKDEDFADFERRGLVNTGILWVRIGNATNNALWTKLKPLLPEIAAAFASAATLVEIL
jgi:predicted nuclease of predicted toxin-antitoxin system